VLRNNFWSDSDVDVLVEFESGRRPGLQFFTLERELLEILGRKVDLDTTGSLSPRIREQVAHEAETLLAGS